jgi:hypothetical protein
MTCARSRKEEKEHLSMIEVSGCMNLLKVQRLKPSFHITHTLSFTEGGPGAMPSKRRRPKNPSCARSRGEDAPSDKTTEEEASKK